MKIPQNNRPSFLLYKSFYEPIKFLKNEELGQLFRAIFDYQNDGEVKNLPPQLSMAFAFFRNQFDLDQKKYVEIMKRNKSNGSRGGRPKKGETQHNPENPVGYLEPKKAEKEKEKEKEKDFERFWNLYDNKKSKPDAFKNFEKAIKFDSVENIMVGLKSFVRSRGVDKKYWKHPAAWLNQQCWKDEYPEVNPENNFLQSLNLLIGEDLIDKIIKKEDGLQIKLKSATACDKWGKVAPEIKDKIVAQLKAEYGFEKENIKIKF